VWRFEGHSEAVVGFNVAIEQPAGGVALLPSPGLLSPA